MNKKASMIFGGLLLCGSAAGIGYSLQASKNKVNSRKKVKPVIIDFETALQNFDYIQNSFELEAILEDMGRFYKISPEKYYDILDFCNELMFLLQQVEDPQITVRKSDIGRAIKYKISALAAASSLRSEIYKIYQSATMMQTFTTYMNHLDEKLNDFVHNIVQIVEEKS